VSKSPVGFQLHSGVVKQCKTNGITASSTKRSISAKATLRLDTIGPFPLILADPTVEV
jgi:hypothetical protein